jgi:hypothetical protein
VGITAEEITAVHVTYGQGIAIKAVAHLEVALIIGSPDIVGFVRGGLRTSRMGTTESSLVEGDESFAFQDIGCGRDCREIRIIRRDDLEQLLWSPGRMFQSCLHDGLTDGGVRFMGTEVRSSRLVGQTLCPMLLITLNPLIASLPADTELKAQFIEREIPFQVLCNKSYSLVHHGNSFPTHRPPP